MTSTPFSARTVGAHRKMNRDIMVAEQTFIGELCHDLRSAITVIGGNADLLLAMNPELEARINPIVAATDRLNGIIEDLLEAAEAMAARDAE